jgi:hypothetical protein
MHPATVKRWHTTAFRLPVVPDDNGTTIDGIGRQTPGSERQS